MVATLGHLGAWAGLYALAAFICFSQLGGIPGGAPLPRWDAMLCALLTATGVYSLDRVKLLSRWLDPADLAAQPERYRFLVPRTAMVRVIAAVLLILAASLGYRIHPFAGILVCLAAIGTVAYAPRPRRTFARVKDRVWLKNAYVAVGMAGFAGLLSVVSNGSEPWKEPVEQAQHTWSVFVLTFVVLALRIFFDAALCDIDDEPTDRAFRTSTFATAWGSMRVWNWAGLGRLALAVGLPFLTALPPGPRLAWSGAMFLGMVALRWRHPVRIRDTVDLRFLPEAAAAAIALWLLPFTSH